MNPRTRTLRAVIRNRRRDPWNVYVPTTFSNGVRALVRRSERWPDRADYRVKGATVFGVFPPDVSLMRELVLYTTHPVKKWSFHAVVYEIDRAYGGPEEGSWYYDTGILVHSERAKTREKAQDRARELLETDFIPNGKVSSVNYRGGDYAAWWEHSKPAPYYPAHTPHYE